MTSYEVFYHDEHIDGMLDDDGDICESGWYWWSCFPGCLPDSDPIGPFPSYSAAESDYLCGLLNGAGWLGLSDAERTLLKRFDYENVLT